MACDQTVLVALHLDGELSPFEGKALETHAASCRDCAQEYRRQRELSAAIRRDVPRFAPPPQMAERLRFALSAEAPRGPAVSRWRWPALAASLLLTAVLSSGVTYQLMAPQEATMALADEVLADHVRSLMANHLTDVASSDQHTVKPWFNGRLKLSPPVKDLTAQGFPLIGGRLDYLGGEPVAALVYRHRQHVINVYVLAAQDAGTASPVSETKQGFNLLRWRDDGLDFWAVSDLNRNELAEFERLIRAAE